MLGPGVYRAQGRFRAWMFEDALPVWAALGRDRPGLGFCEHMTLDGVAADVPFKRLRVQARQIYVFSHAHLLGFEAGAALAADAYSFITTHGLRADGAWVRSMGRDGGVLDPAADLYDIAFTLFALAWFARATGDGAPLALARRSLVWVRANMAAPGGGYFNVVPVEPGHRQQNPHMHLLEAALALYDVSADSDFADLAHELVSLFRTKFYHPGSGTLGEFYDGAWSPAGSEAGTHIEPGHHYEWVWLLDRYTRLFGGQVATEMSRLYAFAETHGRGPDGVAVLDVLGRDGAVRQASSRLWPQTEALKAHVAMVRRGVNAGPRIEAGVTYLLDQHLSACPRGMWREHFAGVGGANIATKIPASSFYHIFLAFAELDSLTASDDQLDASAIPNACVPSTKS